jgi:HSP20 family protein
MANTGLTSKSRRDLAERQQYESPMQLFQNEINRMFDDFFRDPFAPLTFREPALGGEFTPRVDVVESDKDFKVTAELPGMEPKDIQINLEKDTLTLSGEKKSEHEEKQKGYHRIERSYGTFQRVIPLATEIDEEKVDAQFKNGVLTITLPKTPAAVKTAKKIEVKAG